MRSFAVLMRIKTSLYGKNQAMRIFAVFCLILLCAALAFLSFQSVNMSDTLLCRDFYEEAVAIGKENIYFGEALLFFDKVESMGSKEKKYISDNAVVTLNEKLNAAGARGTMAELTSEKMYFAEKELFLSFAELGKLFEYAVRAIRPPYTEIIQVDDYRLFKSASGYLTTVQLSIDFSRYLDNIFLITAKRCELVIYSEIQTYIDSSGLIHCYTLYIKPLNADIDQNTVDYALSAIFKDNNYKKYIFSIYESVVQNIGYIGSNNNKGYAGVLESGINFYTRTN